MQIFANLEEMLAARAINLELDGVSPDTARRLAREHYTHQPHLYRGGYVIPGFGYSVERIGPYVTAETAGNPHVVEKRT